MKRIYTVVFCVYSLFCLIQCSDDSEVVEGKVKGVNLVFTTNGVAKTIYARFIYSTALGRYQLLSQNVVEIKALHEITGEVIYVYALKTGIDLHAPMVNQKSRPDTMVIPAVAFILVRFTLVKMVNPFSFRQAV